MKIAFISNYLNHHQLPVCLEFVKQTNNEFAFIATSTISAERLSFGYLDMNKQYPWVICAYESNKEFKRAKKIIDDADAVIIGSAPDYFIKNRLKCKKLTFRYSERIYKRKPKWYEIPIRFIQHYVRHIRHKNLYMLCASSYTAQDYSKTGAFINKCFKWGYFPEIKTYDNLEKLFEYKTNKSIIWVARFIDLKHPEIAINLAERLAKDGYDFQIKMIGNGKLFDEIKNSVIDKGLQDRVVLLGSISPDRVRDEMEKSQIHIFTSDRNEGWGAVLNEAMNSACACICSDKVGASGFLIKDGVNGYVYKDGDFESFYSKVSKLINNVELIKEAGFNAYNTMVDEWNAENAVKKFLLLANSFFETGSLNNMFSDGVCSQIK